MALREEIIPFVDGNRLVAPNLVPPGTIGGSDNGTCYTSEYYIMLKKLLQLAPQDFVDFQDRIGQCINPQGMLCRVPIGQNDGYEEVDDYYGVLNGCIEMQNTVIPRRFLMALVKNFGFMDNESPGTLWQWATFLFKQPQLVACMVASSFPSFSNPLHFCIRLVVMPLFLVAAVSIGISCIGVDPGNTDARRLAWHLQNNTKGVSLMCWLASKIWLWRLRKTYGADEMKAIAKIYYKDSHPFQKYWVTE